MWQGESDMNMTMTAGQLVTVLVLSIPSLTCFIISGYLALKEKEGWGWFLFAGVIALNILAAR